jgi:hypothetical protein
MNKQELSSHLKQATESIDDILKAAELPLDLPDYSPEQVKVLEEIVKFVETKQAKTYKEAVTLYRKPHHEHQLQEIALRYSQTERISEITAALKLKLGSISEDQFAAFQSVCAQVQQGMDLSIVAQAALDQAKAAKAKKPVAQPEPMQQPEPTSAIAVAQTGAMSSVPESYRESTAKAADNLAQIATEGLSDRMMDAAELSVVEGWEVMPKAIANYVQDAMIAHVQSPQFATNIVDGVKERLRKRGLLS